MTDRQTVAATELAFLLDVDNTLLDNDAVKADLQAQIEGLIGPERARRFWALYEEVRAEKDYVDLSRTLERFTRQFPVERAFPHLADLVLRYPFGASLYPRAMDVVWHLKTLGVVAILSDGDPVYQPAKIARAGLADAVDGNVLIYVHKEQHLRDVVRLLPADLYVLIDDKPQILAAAKKKLGQRLLTIHVRQGKYARAQAGGSDRPDLVVDGIADLLDLGARDFLTAPSA